MSNLKEAAKAELARRRSRLNPNGQTLPDNQNDLKEAARVELARRQHAKREADFIAKGGLSSERTMMDEIKDIPKGIVTGMGSLLDLATMAAAKPIEEQVKMYPTESNIKALQEFQQSLPKFKEGAAEKYHKLTGTEPDPRLEGKESKGQFIGELISPDPFSKFKLGKYGVEGLRLLGKKILESLGAFAGHELIPNVTEQGSAYEDIAKLVLGSIAGGKVSNVAGLDKSTKVLANGQKITPNEQIVADKLKQKMGEQGVAESIAALSNEPVYKTGFTPTTAEATENTVLSQLERARSGAQEGVNNITDKKLEGLEKIYSSIEDLMQKNEKTKNLFTTNAAEGGEALRKTLNVELNALKEQRRSVAKPLYEAAEQNNLLLKPQNTLAAITELEPFAVGNTEQLIKKFKNNYLTGNKITNNEKKYAEFYNAQLEKNSHNPEWVEAFKKHNKPPKTAGEIHSQKLNNARKFLEKRAEALSNVPGRGDEAVDIYKILEGMEQDLLAVPEYAAARKAYEAGSKPINKIVENPTLKRILKTEPGYSKTYSIPEESLANMVIQNSSSVNKAKSILPYLEKNKAQHNQLKGFINHKFLDSVISSHGDVSVANLKNFHKKNPGAFILHPQLKEEVKKANLLTTPLIKDVYENAIKGGSPHKFKQYMKHNKEVLNEYLDKETLDVLNEVEKIYNKKKIVSDKSKTPGSPTAANLSVLGAMFDKEGIKYLRYGLGIAADMLGAQGLTTGINLLTDTVSKIKQAKGDKITQEILDRITTDKDYAKLLLSTPFKDEKSLEQFTKELARYAVKAQTPLSDKGENPEQKQ